MSLIYSDDDQKRVDAVIAKEVVAASKDRREILRSIHSAVYELNVTDSVKMTGIIARFATLLVSLSIQADRIQRWMVILTVTIGVMTFVLLLLTALMTYKMFFP